MSLAFNRRRVAHRDRPTQVAKIDSRIRSPSRPHASSCQISRPVAENARSAVAPRRGDLDLERGEQRLQVGRRDPLEARSRAGRGSRRRGPAGSRAAPRPRRSGRGPPAACRGRRSPRPGRASSGVRSSSGTAASACGSPPPGGVEPDVGDLLARVDDPPHRLAGRDGVGEPRSAAPSRGRPRGSPGRSSARSASRSPRGRRWSSRAGRGPSPTTRSITAGDRAGSFQRASTRTCSRVPAALVHRS